MYVFCIFLFCHSLPRCFSRCSDAVYWSLWCGLICLMFNMMFVQNAKAPNKQREARSWTSPGRSSAVTAAPTRDQGWHTAAQTAFTAFISCSDDNFSLLAGSWLFWRLLTASKMEAEVGVVSLSSALLALGWVGTTASVALSSGRRPA